MRMLFVLLFFPALLICKECEIDLKKSRINFTAPARLGDVNGEFKRWYLDGKIAGCSTVSGQIIIDVASIDTGIVRRDTHLRTPDFFNTEQFPRAIFRIASSRLTGAEMSLEGELELHGIKAPLTIVLNGKSGSFKGKFLLNRQKFGITYSSRFNPIGAEIQVDLLVILLERPEK